MDYSQMRDRLVQDVLSKKEGFTVAEIVNKLKSDDDSLFPSDESNSIEKLVKEVLRNETKSSTSPIITSTKKRGAKTYKLRPARMQGPKSKCKPSTDTDDTLYIGKAGEYAVLSELVARGYNACIMTIDEGVDIVASKDNIFYYVQVKTRYFDENGRVSFQIPVKSFERVQNGKVVYILVAREAIGVHRYFIFHQDEIKRLDVDGYIEKTDANYNIKLSFDSITNEPILYNGKETRKARSFMAEVMGFEL